MKKILLTGGGTAGHVTPNIALLPSLKKAGYEIKYMGSYDGIEKKLIEELGIDYTLEGVSPPDGELIKKANDILKTSEYKGYLNRQ